MKKCMYKIYTYVCILFTQNTNLKYKQISNFIIAYNTIYPQILDSKLRSIVNHGIDIERKVYTNLSLSHSTTQTSTKTKKNQNCIDEETENPENSKIFNF